MKNKFLLVLLLALVVLPLVSAQEFASETKNDWKVEWYWIEKGMTSDAWVIAIQNQNSLFSRGFDLNVIMNEANINLNDIEITGLYEWENVPYNIYTLKPPIDDCEFEIFPNGTRCNSVRYEYEITEGWRLEWKETKNLLIKETNDKELKEGYGEINIPKLGSEQEDATVNGTKWFKLTYNKPIQNNNFFGSAFNLMLENDGETYHPFVLSGWNFKKTIGITVNNTKENVNATFNITFDYADILTGNLTKELRFIAENTSDEGIEIGWNLLGNYTDGEGGGSALVMFVLRGAAYNYSFYYGNASATQSPEYGFGNEHFADGQTVALYHFNGDYTDSSPNGYDATGIATVLQDSGTCVGLPLGTGGCVYLDEGTQYVNMSTNADNTDWDLGDDSKSFTVSMDAVGLSAIGVCNLFTRWWHEASERTYLIGSDDINVNNMRILLSPDGSGATSSNGAVLGGNFEFRFAFVFDNPNDVMQIYLNGKLTGGDTAFATDVMDSDKAPAVVGDDGSGGTCNDVRVDEVWITTEVKTDWSGAVEFSLSAREQPNIAPTAPLLKSPLNESNIADTNPQFEWFNSTDDNGDAITYTIYVANDSDFSNTVYSNTSIAEQGKNQTNVTLPFELLDGDYYWRVIGTDGLLNGSFSNEFTFTLSTKPAVTTPGITPIQIDNITDINVSTVATDPTAGSITVDFILEINGVQIANVSTSGLSTGTNTTVIFNHANYSHFDSLFINVFASNALATGLPANTTVTVINTPPTAPTVILPAINFTTFNASVLLSCNGSTDLDNDSLFFEFYQDNAQDPNTLKQNSTSNFYDATKLANGVHYWKCRANDQVGNKSANTSAMNFTIDFSNIKTSAFEWILETTETSIKTFATNITYNSLMLEDVIANIEYNSTNFSVSATSSTNGTKSFSIDINIPAVSANVNKTFNWTFTNLFYNGSRSTNISANFEQLITDTALVTCIDGNTSHEIIAKFPILYEPNATIVNDNVTILTTFEANFDIWIGNEATASQILVDDSNKTVYNICAFPKGINWTANAEIDYDAIGTPPRQHYLRDIALNGTNPFSQDLFLLETGLATSITFEILDVNEAPLANHFVEVERKDFATATFTLVAIGKTDDDGFTTIPLEQINAFYRFKIYDDFTLLKTTADTQITGTTIEISISEETEGEVRKQFGAMNYTFFFDNDTKEFKMTFLDSAGKITSGCMRVSQLDFNSEGVIYDQCFLASTGSLTFTIPNNSSAYTASVYATIGSGLEAKKSLIETISIDLTTSFSSMLGGGGIDGVVMTLFLMMVLVLLATWNPSVAVGAGVVSLIFSVAFGFYVLSIGTLIGIIVVGAIFMYKIRT